MSSLPDNTDTTLRPQTRREALKTVAILAGASVLPHSASAETAARRKRVIVAGGGIGGPCYEFQPFGIGLDHLDEVLLGDLLAQDGASDAAIRFIGGRRSTPAKPATSSDISALFRLWQDAIRKLRGIPTFSRDVFHLKGGNQLLPDTFAAKLGDRVRKNCPVTAIEHDSTGVRVEYEESGAKKRLAADYLMGCLS